MVRNKATLLGLLLLLAASSLNELPVPTVAETYKEPQVLNVRHFRDNVIKPVLEYLDMYSPAMENLLVGTALQESRLVDLRRTDTPAFGVYQMEPATYYDHYQTYLVYHQGLRTKLIGLKTGLYDDAAEELAGNLYYATALAAIHYKRRLGDKPLPEADDIHGLARVYKRLYNTPKGAATEAQFVTNYEGNA